MKHLKVTLLTISVCLTLLAQQATAKPKFYIAPKNVLVDKDIDFKNNPAQFPRGCFDLKCEICCGGIPPSCSTDELTCNIAENPDFSSLDLIFYFLMAFVLGKSSNFQLRIYS